MTDFEHEQTTRDGKRNDDNPWRSAREVLGTGTENGWIFGVCAAIARRTGWELWAVRAVAIVILLMFWWIPVALAYVVIAMLLDETRPGAQFKLKRWARKADDVIDALWSGLKKLVNSNRRETYSRHDGL